MSLLRRLSREARPGAILLRLLLVTLLDEALGEFAGFATWRFVSALEEKLYIGNMARLSVAQVPLAGGGDALPTPDELRRVRDRRVECRCAWVTPTLLHFRAARGDGPATVASGEAASSALRRWLADTVLAQATVDSLHPLGFRTLRATPPDGRWRSSTTPAPPRRATPRWRSGAHFAPLAQSSGVRWRVALQDGLVAYVDRDALRQILLDLLDNAVKYGPAGQTVTVVLILTARQEERDKVRGFRLGADDDVTKPFGLDELLARVGALLRRARVAAGPEVVRFGDVELLPKQHLVRRAGVTVELRPMELEPLLALAARRNEMTRARAADAARGLDTREREPVGHPSRTSSGAGLVAGGAAR